MKRKKQASPRVLGVYLGHDLGACLLIAGQIATMIEEERLTRLKHGRPDSVSALWAEFAGRFGYFPWASISYCLAANDLGIDDLDLVVIGDDSWGAGLRDTVHDFLPIRDKNKIVFATEPKGAVHHYHHALSAFFASQFDSSSVLVIDADGSSDANGYEAESGFFFPDRSGRCELIFKNRYRTSEIPKDGLGWMYEQVSRILGFFDKSVFVADAGKTMGLAGYGSPRPDFSRSWIEHNGFELDFSGFRAWMTESGYNDHIVQKLPGLMHGKTLLPFAADIAFKAQAELEGSITHLATQMHQLTQSRNLCLAGGVALNSVANGILASSGLFERIFVQPAANDGGQSLGAAYHGHLILKEAGHRCANLREKSSTGVSFATGVPPIQPIRNAFGGRSYSRDEIRRLLDFGNLSYLELSPDELAMDAATELTRGRFIGWVQGGSEFGPRALGHRSILADPRGTEVKNTLNARVKFRELFRPFAPSVLEERAKEIFDLTADSPYMLMVGQVRENWKTLIPAVVHVDGSARVQTVDPEVDLLFHSLIEAFCSLTDIPLVLNTSFNLRGMPIVESPSDALQCFVFTDLDILYLGNLKVEQPTRELMFLERVPGVEVTLGGFSNLAETRHLKVSLKRESVQLNFSEWIVELLRELDGKRTLEELESLKTKRDDDASVLRVSKALLRAGMLRLRIGALSFDRAGVKIVHSEKERGEGSNDRPSAERQVVVASAAVIG